MLGEKATQPKSPPSCCCYCTRSCTRLMQRGHQARNLATYPLAVQAYVRLHSTTRLPCAARPFLGNPNPFSLSAAARAAASASDLRLVGALHAAAVICGLHAHVVVATAILDAYSKCGDLYSSRKLFDAMPHRNVVSCNAMVAGYANAGISVAALDLFYDMRCTGFQPSVDEYTMASSLAACARISDLGTGAQIHGYAVKAGFEADHAVVSSLTNMYFWCSDVECARRAMEGRESCFLSSKLLMVKGFVANGRYSDALEFIVRHALNDIVDMIMMDCGIMTSILTVCAHLGLLRIGKLVHGFIVILGADGDNAVLCCALIDMYCKCSKILDAQSVFDSLREKHVACWNSLITGYIHNGLLEKARRLFDEMPNKNVISWTAMISGYVQKGFPEAGLQLMASLYSQGGLIQGNCFTFAVALDACSGLASLASGKQIHALAVRTWIQVDHKSVVLETALVDMYSKSGNLKYARRVFDNMVKKNVVSWTSMINGYAIHGSGLEAIKVFEQMISMGVEPNKITFVAALTACSRCGLVNQAVHYFNLMTERYGIVPNEDHYTCIIDMLSRAGKLAEAWKLLEELKIVRGNNENASELHNAERTSIWGALLAGCSLHGEVAIGAKVATKMIASREQVSESYVALSNIYAASDMWDEVYRVREDWRKQGALREPGQSQVQFDTLT